jgi:hypothetical protein
MIYEILNDAGEVINRIIADEAFVERKYPGHYRLVGPVPTPPLPPPPPVLPIITKLAFRFRLTDAEYVGILSAAKTDVEVMAWVETFNIVSQVNLDDLRTASGLEMMVTKSLLTEERKTEILTAPVQDSERP